MSDERALTIAQKAWDCWVAADLEGFLAFWDADGVWTLQGHSRISGSWHGPKEIATVAQTAFEVSGGTLKARPIELVEAGADSVLGYFHLEASRPGATIDQDGLQRFVVRNGKMASLHNLFSDVDQVDAFYK